MSLHVSPSHAPRMKTLGVQSRMLARQPPCGHLYSPAGQGRHSRSDGGHSPPCASSEALRAPSLNGGTRTCAERRPWLASGCSQESS